MPTNGTPNGESLRAILSMVPSPPITMARLARRAISSIAMAGNLSSAILEAVRQSSTTCTPHLCKYCPNLNNGATMSGFLYFPIRAIVLNRELIEGFCDLLQAGLTHG